MGSPGFVEFPFASDEVIAGVTTRHGGTSVGEYGDLNLGDHVGDDHETVVANRETLRRSLGLESLAFFDQQHQARVAVVDEETAGRGFSGAADAKSAFPDTDAAVTNVRGAGLAILVADCVPVVLWDPVRRVVGAAHAGRTGVLRGVVPATVAALAREYGTAPTDLLAGLGPSIKQGSYEVGEAEAKAMRQVFPGLQTAIPSRPGHYLLDILGPLCEQLRGAGVRDENVSIMDVDTFSSTGDFFSDRRRRPCGRFAGVIALR